MVLGGLGVVVRSRRYNGETVMIYIFTHSYPYARRGEVFLNDEKREVQTMGLADEVRFVPL